MKTKVMPLSMVAFLATLLSFSGQALAQSAPQPREQGGFPVLKTIKEVFLKGSIDGKKMFLVFGVQNAAEGIKDMMTDVIQERELRAIAHDVYNKEHDDDYAGEFKDGVRAMKNHAPQILQAPWDSIQKIPHAYQVSFASARDAYYNSKNPIAGALKYSGFAVWANIEGAYYLIIETPIEFAYELLSTALAVPMRLALQTVELAWDLSWTATKTVVRFAFCTAFSVIGGAYALLNSTTAATLTLMAAGGLAIIDGGRFVFVDLPHLIAYPVSARKQTGIEFNGTEQEEIARKARDVLAAAPVPGYENLKPEVTMDGNKYKSRIVSNVRLEDGTELKTLLLTVGIKKKQVYVKLEMTRTAFRILKKAAQTAGTGKSELKNALRAKMNAILEQIVKPEAAPAATVQVADAA